MNKDEALDLAEAALLWANREINGWKDDAYGYDPEDHPEIMAAIAAINQARSAPVQEPWGYGRMSWGEKIFLPTLPSVRDGGWMTLYTTPAAQPAPTVQEPVAWIDSVMEQAQIFASAWSLVGGRFDSGNGLEDAEQAKAELRAMLITPPAQPAPVQPVAITTGMALAFHRATSDGSISDAEAKEIKRGLEAAFAHITTPPAAPVQEPVLQEIEQYRLQMAGISTAALGYWKEGDSIHPDYDTPALRDVAKLYTKYAALHAATRPAVQEPVAWRLNGESSLGHGKVFGEWKSGKPPKDVADLASVDKNWSLEFAYTTPPAARRQWVGLTDDELRDLCEEFWVYPIKLLQAIEAKLKEKNA
jgi:hypothetical protein